MTDTLTCPMCGFQNQIGAARCASCGAKIEAFGQGDYTEDEVLARRFQQDTFELKWAAIAAGIYLAFQGIFLVLLPLVFSNFDPQGLAGLAISVVIWFFGGLVVGAISPGRTFIEPAAGAAAAMLPTIMYQRAITPEGFEPSLLAYIVAGLLGVMIALFGAFLGEKVQMGKSSPTV